MITYLHKKKLAVRLAGKNEIEELLRIQAEDAKISK